MAPSLPMLTDRLRVALISEHAAPVRGTDPALETGEAERIGQLARALARRGHRVDILTRRSTADLPSVVEWQPGVRVLQVEAGSPAPIPEAQRQEHMAAFARESARLLASDDPRDSRLLVHAHGYLSGLAGLRLARSSHLPLVVTLQPHGGGGAAAGLVPERAAIERALAQQADAVIAECPQDRADLIRLYGARPSRISTVPRGVDVEVFAPGDKARARRALGWSDDEFVVLQLGRIDRGKAIDNVIAALARLPRALRARLVVVGGEPTAARGAAPSEIARLQALAHAAGIGDRVCFTGPRARAELPDFYVAADVFVATPTEEPFGITALEAMACGTPVIGSAVGGLRHTVAPGVSGWLVPPGDPEALASQLARLRSHPQVALSLGRGGVQRVRTLFTWDRVAAELAAVYRAAAPAARPLGRLSGLAASAGAGSSARPAPSAWHAAGLAS